MPSSHLILWCPLLLRLSTFPSIRDFSNKHLFTSDDQNTGASASASICPVNIQGRSPLTLTGLISLLSKELSGVFSSTTSWKASILYRSAFFTVQLSQPYVTTGKTIALIILSFVGKVMSLLFKILSRFVIVFLPRSKCLLIWLLQSQSTVILEPKKRKCVTTSTFPPLYLPWSNEARYHNLSWLCFVFF